jgi:hypothetical protein
MEWSQLHSLPDLSRIEVLHAHFVQHRYPRHAHEHAVVGLVDSGSVSIRYQGSRHHWAKRDFFVILKSRKASTL